MLAAAGLMLLTSFDRGTPAVLRLDWFAPVLRRHKPHQHASHSLPGRFFRWIIPDGLQSDRMSKQRGVIRKTLRRFGLSWLASPVRRVVQSFCLAAFIGLFFYVCWPYDAQPLPEGRVSEDWSFIEIDQDSGEFVFAREFHSGWTVRQRQTVYVVEDGNRTVADAVIQEFDVVNAEISTIDKSSLHLKPNGDLTADLFDSFMTSDATWTLHETDPSAWPSHYTDNLARKEIVPAETFLMIDPLVSISTALASRSWVWSLASAAAILIVCVLIPRGFCGYLCPLGTTIDLFDWAIGKRVERFRVPDDGWWVHIKYYLLAGTLLCSVFGVLVSGFFSAIPVITRGMLFLFEPLQTGVMRGWHLIPTINAGQVISILFIFCRARAWIFPSTILVQIRLSQRGGLFARQSLSCFGAQGRIVLHSLQQVCRDLSL